MILKNKTLLTIVLIWAAWAAIILGFQTLVSERVEPQRPDYSREWTPEYTLKDSNDGHIYLTEPFMNRQVAWDSEYYLSIAVAGYPDLNSNSVRLRSGERLSLNYAFFPLYPLAAGALAVPLRVLNLTPIATATLAGVILSLLGALVGAISLYDLARDQAGRGGRHPCRILPADLSDRVLSGADVYRGLIRGAGIRQPRADQAQATAAGGSLRGAGGVDAGGRLGAADPAGAGMAEQRPVAAAAARLARGAASVSRADHGADRRAAARLARIWSGSTFSAKTSTLSSRTGSGASCSTSKAREPAGKLPSTPSRTAIYKCGFTTCSKRRGLGWR